MDERMTDKQWQEYLRACTDDELEGICLFGAGEANKLDARDEQHRRRDARNEPCKCHPDCDVGTGEPCLNCGEPPHKHKTVGYCRNSTRQWDWYTHRQEVR